jgi:tetratricopeptide (TPR) repeat protein
VTGSPFFALQALVEKSLVRRIGSDRYGLHGLLAQFAADKLEEDPVQLENARAGHAQYFAQLLERERTRLEGARGSEALRGLTLELENVRQAWRTAVAQNATSLAEQSVESLYLFYDRACRFKEGLDLLTPAIDRWMDDEVRRHLLAKVLARVGALRLQLSDYAGAEAALERALGIVESFDVEADQVFCLIHLSAVARRQGDYEKTARLSAKALELSQKAGDVWGVTHALLQLGLARYRQGDVDEAEDLLKRSLEAAQRSERPGLIAAPLNLLGDIASHRGNYGAGLRLLERCLTVTRQLADQFRVAIALNNLGTVLHCLEQVEEARASYRESLEICREIGDREGQAIALSNLGEIALEAGANEEAATLMRQGLALAREIDDQWAVMACLNSLGEATYELGDREQAQRYFIEALAVAEETQTLPMLFKALVNLGIVFFETGQSGLAVEVLGVVRDHGACEQLVREKAARHLEDTASESIGSGKRSLEKIVAEILSPMEEGQPSLPSSGLEGAGP